VYSVIAKTQQKQGVLGCFRRLRGFSDQENRFR
ncbi:MAG: hypothetical protein ACI9TH_004122, partial [Kiritimatiellia bacterium]